MRIAILGTGDVGQKLGSGFISLRYQNWNHAFKLLRK